jgi:DNA polymerase III epsilon subunit-like protein
MIKENRFIVFDTETKGVDLKAVYDVGWFIVNKHAHIYAARRFLVKEIITNPEIMRDAFYNRKIYTNYIPMLDNSRKPMLAPWADIALTMRRDIRNHNASILCAYNLPFDLAAMRTTSHIVGYTGTVLTRKPRLLCLWQFACQHLFTQPTYKTVANRVGWVSESGNYRTTAEHAYSYLTCNYEYKEPHTALEDAEIEVYILHRLLKLKKKIPYDILNSQAWRIPQDVK